MVCASNARLPSRKPDLDAYRFSRRRQRKRCTPTPWLQPLPPLSSRWVAWSCRPGPPSAAPHRVVGQCRHPRAAARHQCPLPLTHMWTTPWMLRCQHAFGPHTRRRLVVRRGGGIASWPRLELPPAPSPGEANGLLLQSKAAPTPALPRAARPPHNAGAAAAPELVDHLARRWRLLKVVVRWTMAAGAGWWRWRIHRLPRWMCC